MVLKYATGNSTKLAGAKKFLEPLGITVEQVNIDIPEIQADTNEEVAINSSKYAFSQLSEMVLKNDGGLVIPALKGFPGVYARYIEETLGAEGILKLMDGLEGEDRNAYFIECLALTEDDGTTKVFTCKTPGHISHEMSGEYG
ncbi:MAG: non-canonical purine NTP pyrophosphatase [Clostridia bacterium]|nr:non-canonical purine NTP pyrophosphatase [Clostridia bacterium]